MSDCRKSHLIFQNFLGETPRPPAGARVFGARFGASPPYQNSWIRPWSVFCLDQSNIYLSYLFVRNIEICRWNLLPKQTHECEVTYWLVSYWLAP